MVVQFSFWHVFGLSVESVEAQPVYGCQRGQSEEDATIYFFDGYIFNVPFVKVMVGTVYGLADD